VCEPASSVDGHVSKYNCTLKNLLDKRAPQKSRLGVDRPLVHRHNIQSQTLEEEAGETNEQNRSNSTSWNVQNGKD